MKIIVAKDVDAGNYHEMYIGRTAVPMRSVNPTKIDWDTEGAHRQNQLWIVDDAHIELAMLEVSKWHPGIDISVFTLTDVFFRPAGELSRKLVSKDGVLPS